MSINEDEIREYLEAKKLKEITLPQNSNDIDQGALKSKEILGDKNLAAADKEKRLARAEYIIERDKKMQYGDKQAIAEYMTQQTELRQRLEAQRERQRLEDDLLCEEETLKKKLSRITPEDRENERLDIEKYGSQKDKEIANVYDYFNCTEEFWEKWQSDGHKPEESPANVLIGTGTVGFVCDIHRYIACIPFPDGRLATSAFTIGPIEDHIRRDVPEVHKTAIIQSINEKYDKLIQARKEQTLEDPDIKFKKELRQIHKIPTRPGGDYGLLNSGTKLTKGQKARLREAEEAQQEENKRIYGGLYS